jgi:hypothetical protein
VNDALDAWDVSGGASVGLEASMGVLAHGKFSLFFHHALLLHPLHPV